jgi:hypothetical protein
MILAAGMMLDTVHSVPKSVGGEERQAMIWEWGWFCVGVMVAGWVATKVVVGQIRMAVIVGEVAMGGMGDEVENIEIIGVGGKNDEELGMGGTGLVDLEKDEVIKEKVLLVR